MTDEQAAAVERLRNKKAQGWQYRFGPSVVDDLRVVADLYLAEHPADDCEPVTEDWLRSVGFNNSGGEFWLREGVRAGVRFHQNYRPSLIVEGFGIEWDGSRGWIRRLCAALQIPLTEQETAT